MSALTSVLLPKICSHQSDLFNKKCRTGYGQCLINDLKIKKEKINFIKFMSQPCPIHP